MTPKEKARELFDKYQIAGSQYSTDQTKKYASILCDELIERLPNINLVAPIDRKSEDNYLQYWHSVKRELNSL
jgi:hypothetical protein